MWFASEMSAGAARPVASMTRCGTPSPHSTKTTYAQVNHRHFQQLLAEREDLKVSYTSLRRILQAAGLRSPKRRRPRRHRRRRERMRVGMLLQVDGSTHDWLEGRVVRG